MRTTPAKPKACAGQQLMYGLAIAGHHEEFHPALLKAVMKTLSGVKAAPHVASRLSTNSMT